MNQRRDSCLLASAVHPETGWTESSKLLVLASTRMRETKINVVYKYGDCVGAQIWLFCSFVSSPVGREFCSMRACLDCWVLKPGLKPTLCPTPPPPPSFFDWNRSISCSLPVHTKAPKPRTRAKRSTRTKIVTW